ncbi:YciK family oxidoreductase [Vibrio albus]|uniref:YciK family oxidoreductase n=1 Tax=Vibrio albus TaxID=2200953 RepID=A0A2U3BDY9_9VIBR|nr:YciK family oxidoreductase [Vibrio albus]PWI34983.1 YciK family oxidoreductase [Vibrio albus]
MTQNQQQKQQNPLYFVPEQALKDKVILVTGAGDGIGKQAAITFAEYGAKLVLLSRTKSKLEQVAEIIEKNGYPKPMLCTLDMLEATRRDYHNVTRKIEEEYNGLDGLLHSAGQLGGIVPFEEIAENVFDELIQVNVKAQLMLTQSLLPLLHTSNNGRIIFTSSTVGHIGRALWGGYAISKFATEGMMQVLADELKETRIRVNAINPGATRTNMRAKAKPEEDPNTIKTPLDIMPLYLYLMSEESEDVNGQCIDAQPK